MKREATKHSRLTENTSIPMLALRWERQLKEDGNTLKPYGQIRMMTNCTFSPCRTATPCIGKRTSADNTINRKGKIIMGNNVRAIIDEQAFTNRLREANAIKRNPRTRNPEAVFYSRFPLLPEDMPEAFMRRV